MLTDLDTGLSSLSDPDLDDGAGARVAHRRLGLRQCLVQVRKL
jgi:hypothetical protein